MYKSYNCLTRLPRKADTADHLIFFPEKDNAAFFPIQITEPFHHVVQPHILPGSLLRIPQLFSYLGQTLFLRVFRRIAYLDDKARFRFVNGDTDLHVLRFVSAVHKTVLYDRLQHKPGKAFLLQILPAFHFVLQAAGIAQHHHPNIVVNKFQLVPDFPRQAWIAEHGSDNSCKHDNGIRHLYVIRHHGHPADGIE